MALQRLPRPGRSSPSRSSPQNNFAVHPLVRSAPLRSLPRGFAAASDDAAPSPRVSVPCGAISMGSPLAPELCLLRFVPSPGFHNLLTAYSSQCLVALFRATGTRWVLPSELSSLQGAVPPLDGHCPLVVPCRYLDSEKTRRPVRAAFRALLSLKVRGSPHTG